MQPDVTFARVIRALMIVALHGCSASGEPPLPTATALPSAGSSRVRTTDGMQMLYVPAGEFQMGSDYLQTAYGRELCRQYTTGGTVAACQASNFGDESPAHIVRLNDYWIDRTEVTNDQYRKCQGARVCGPPIETHSHYRVEYYDEIEYGDFPVIFVTRRQAAAYCAWAGGRLPTEAEWEYAARGPDSRIFPWGDEFDGTRLNYCDRNCDAGPSDPAVDDGYADTAMVGSYPSGASWVGALDMAGNVREWVADGYGPYTAESVVNPGGLHSSELSIPRGGSWIDSPSLVRSANRGGNVPGYYRDYYGFRCVMDAAQVIKGTRPG